ncbi:WAT1-related protein At3g02690, chloroplastic-like isoform X1 [Quercus lobata]|uniref:WAT1-related protein At3g02690, chloroplastic-like isoform X1 n=1 Tax=Quercus lobata TaxID=97700 RepID=UPI0012469D8A|nr:WAT1-related protein At3g02690, chloroplastic-like isoform X1 [Quercus lobata]
MGSWRWSSTSAFYPSYCRCHAPLSLHNFSFSTPSSSSSSSKISTGIKARLQLQHYNKKTTTNNNVKNRKNFTGFKDIIVRCTSDTTNTDLEEKQQEQEAVGFDSVSTGQDNNKAVAILDENSKEEEGILELVWEWAVLVSPFFFWGTAMVAMKEVIPKYGPFFVSAFRTIPAGFLLIAFAASRARPFPSGLTAWLSITLFALVDAACFQGFLAEGLQKTSAGLGSVIIDSQPLTVAILASLLFGESIGFVGGAGLVLGVIGLLLLEVSAISFDSSNFTLWGSGEWWMLLAAQSMAIGTVMVRWVSKYSDPIMATGWHMVIGGLPLVTFSILNHDPAVTGSLKEFTANDVLALLYTSIFGSAVSYGVFFYNATKGSLTKLSSLTFLTPMFASIFGFIYLGETFSPLQLVGAVVTLVAIYMVNYRNVVE